ncbi:MAG: hypothetical protein DI535_00830 [Citrobacter freundii]|nr:MAG: hypothetical protein DI535_00830 [Citrobacter freundii]
MISFEQALMIAKTEVDKPSMIPEGLTIQEELIMELPYAWIFPYTSKLYAETYDIKYAVGGNSPIFVSKSNGKISYYRSGLSLNDMIDEYEEENKYWQLILSLDLSDISSWRTLKDVLNWSQSSLSQFKSSGSRLLDEGARSRLTKIHTVLAIHKIDTEIILKSTI